ncbi:hypothetical protein [Mycoplana dimorpha]|nr:hypothetical protein [Mycoplana dimorpha]
MTKHETSGKTAVVAAPDIPPQPNYGAGPLWREFYGALVMSVPPAIEPADQRNMKILTMPDAHAIVGTRDSFPFAHDDAITFESEVSA